MLRSCGSTARGSRSRRRCPGKRVGEAGAGLLTGDSTAGRGSGGGSATGKAWTAAMCCAGRFSPSPASKTATTKFQTSSVQHFHLIFRVHCDHSAIKEFTDLGRHCLVALRSLPRSRSGAHSSQCDAQLTPTHLNCPALQSTTPCQSFATAASPSQTFYQPIAPQATSCLTLNEHRFSEGLKRRKQYDTDRTCACLIL